MRLIFRSSLLVLGGLSAGVLSCSNFILPTSDDLGAVISGRTMDLGWWDSWELISIPAGQHPGWDGMGINMTSDPTLSYVGIYPITESKKLGVERAISAGMNSAGLSIDAQTLIYTVYPEDPKDGSGVLMVTFPEWCLANYRTVAEAKLALNEKKITVWGPDALEQHYILRDATGASIVVEFMGGETQVYDDANDGVDTFGVTTNEPVFPWHIENVKHYEWKQTLARPAVGVPGAFYPDERFLRLHSLKQGLDTPTTYQEVVQQAVHLLNSVTIPAGEIMGTDSGAGEGAGDHTIFGLVYDHGAGEAEPALYWRSYHSQSLQRVRLSDMDTLDKRYLSIANELDWYMDVSNEMTLMPEEQPAKLAAL
mmetsp:Transcript_79746/g.227619  ORF Transcript_79746/g.227619 Transcript_79746/m.227619 type:complete len:367 (+) Transcript_79746:71-1171(+)